MNKMASNQKIKLIRPRPKFRPNFRGHITRKKLKGEKKGDAPAAEAEANEKDEAAVAEGTAEERRREKAPLPRKPAPSPEKTGKAGETPFRGEEGEGAPDAAPQSRQPPGSCPLRGEGRLC